MIFSRETFPLISSLTKGNITLELEVEKADITIIGAGVIGLAIAAQLARQDLSIFILEKNTSHGGGISSRSNEIIHAGIYYPEESLKAELCVTGRHLLYEMATTKGISHQKIGKLFVATNHEEIEEIEKLHKNGLNRRL